MNDWNLSQQDRRPGRMQAAPNYLNANIAMFGVNLTWVLFVIWATLGFAFVMIAGVLINAAITMLQARLSR